MSQERLQQVASFKAGASISAFRIVGPHTTTAKNTVAQWATATSIMIGLSVDDYSTDAAAGIAILGTAKAQCGASVTMWAPMTGQTDTAKVIDAISLAPTTSTLVVPHTVGIALENGSTDGVIEVLIRPSNLRFDF